MRGERGGADFGLYSPIGSSPHARGTPDGGSRHVPRRRIIPACAGNARRAWCIRPPAADHPRMRGERGSSYASTRCGNGSSPHARGTQARGCAGTAQSRIIPACAGNATVPGRAPGTAPDHPRMRGERRASGLAVGYRAGSSPHARGTQAREDRAQRRPRIIPACAGNAVRRADCGRPPTDHPHMRGERAHARAQQARAVGSSPHARGTRALSRAWCPAWRIIPACAGNATPRRRKSRASPDHPRMRGERDERVSATHGVCGSSPHARGTPWEPSHG